MKRTPPSFQQAFSMVAGLTLLSGVVSFWLATQSSLSLEQNHIFDICNNTWNMGIGAIFGLLARK